METLNILDVCQDYGIVLDSHNRALCPFHKEKTPSFTVTPERNLFFCFSCTTGGDSIRLKALLTGVSDGEIVGSLEDDSGTSEERERAKKERLKRTAEREAKEFEKQRLLTLENNLYRVFFLLEREKEKYAPKLFNADWSADFIRTVKLMFYVECEIYKVQHELNHLSERSG